MDTTRIAALLAPFLEEPLQISQLDQISTYIDLLLRWNARINLSAIRNPEEIVTRHFGESLFMARHLFPSASQQFPTPGHPVRSHVIREADGVAESKDPYPTTAPSPTHVLDIGSGAGFPALPLKIWSPEIHLTLIESNHKKAAFLREVARALTLTDINVITDRAETLAAREDFPRTNVVILRAVENFQDILPHAAAFLRPKGTLALLIGADQARNLTTLASLKWCDPIPVPQSIRKVLSIGVRGESGEY